MWLKDYLTYTHRHEAPSMFHLWVGLSLISSALGRKCSLPKGYYTLYPNLFVVLVAGSARCKKSTAIDIGAKLFADVKDVNTIGVQTGSREKFLRRLIPEEGEKPKSTLIFADELSVFLSRDQQGDKLMDDLLVLYNSPKEYVYDTYKHGKLIIPNPYITIITGTQPERIDKVLPDMAVGGGFTSRLILVYQKDTDKERSDFQEMSESERLLADKLSAGLQRMSMLNGAFSLDPQARAFYDPWYRAIETSDDYKMDGFISRKHDHVLKIAMLMSASRGNSMVIDEGDLQSAIKAVDTVQLLMHHALAGVGSVGGYKIIADRILRILEHFGQMAYSDLLKRCYGLADGETFKKIMVTLIQSKLIHQGDGTMYVYGPPKG